MDSPQTRTNRHNYCPPEKLVQGLASGLRLGRTRNDHGKGFFTTSSFGEAGRGVQNQITKIREGGRVGGKKNAQRPKRQNQGQNLLRKQQRPNRRGQRKARPVRLTRKTPGGLPSRAERPAMGTFGEQWVEPSIFRSKTTKKKKEYEKREGKYRMSKVHRNSTESEGAMEVKKAWGQGV